MYFYLDFEYRDNTKASEIVLVSYMSSEDKVCHTLDLRDGKNKDLLNKIFKQYKAHTWVAYNAIADLTCLLTLGVDIEGVKLIDAMVEARMLTLTHHDFIRHKADLLTSLHAFGIKSAVNRRFKNDVRQVILNNQQYSKWKWQQIKTYGPTDVKPLPELLKRIWQAHREIESPIKLSDMLTRGEYLKTLTILSFHNKGFPVDTALLHRVFDNKAKVICHLQQQVNDKYGELYTRKKNASTMTFNTKRFKKLVVNKGYDWTLTDKSQMPLLDKAYFKKKVQQFPELRLLYDVRKTLRALSYSNLVEQCKDGYIKPALFPFAQKAGRNNHLPTKGFMLNLAPWMRSLIRPEPEKLIIGADWGQQEIAIAAVLSGDKNYLDVYNNKEGDVYLTLAKMAGAVPQDATKDSHPMMRHIFKSIQLGLGYGKGIKSLAVDVYESNKDEQGHFLLSKPEAYDLASNIYHWHKQTFNVYWEWIDDVITLSRSAGYYRSLDGWTYFIDSNTKDTQLINLPMQTNGAAMLRRAVIRCLESKQIDLLCTHHDALYISCDAKDKETAVEQLIGCMNEACADILGDKIKIRIDLNTYDSTRGYSDPRGVNMLRKINELLIDVAV